ncbi:MAG: hypothetical protein M1825_005730 [Sarcosagium campestre]|nr:MAG: hypothetical protein M1825_005730 [Sarcosagium campestre]
MISLTIPVTVGIVSVGSKISEKALNDIEEKKQPISRHMQQLEELRDFSRSLEYMPAATKQMSCSSAAALKAWCLGDDHLTIEEQIKQNEYQVMEVD